MKLPKVEKRKRISVLATLCFLTALALLLSNGVVTLAKYFGSTQREGTAAAEPFYFSSDKLDEKGTYYQLDSTGGSTVTITFTLRNYVDAYRVTSKAFQCKYQVTTLADDGSATTSTPTQVSFGSAKQEETISIPLDEGYFSGDKKVTVTAWTEAPDAPYAKTISAEFGFAKGQAQLQSSVSETGNAVVLEIGGAQGEVTVSWPAALIPDRSNPMLQGAGSTSITFTADSSTRYAFTFLKTDPTAVYSDKDFTVE